MKIFMDYLRVFFRLIALILNQLIFTLIGLGLYFLYHRRQKKRLRYISIFSRHWARWSCFIMNIRVRVTSVTSAPTPRSASRMISKHRIACPYASLGACMLPSGLTGAVPVTKIRSSARSARQYPTSLSQRAPLNARWNDTCFSGVKMECPSGI